MPSPFTANYEHGSDPWSILVGTFARNLIAGGLPNVAVPWVQHLGTTNSHLPIHCMGDYLFETWQLTAAKNLHTTFLPPVSMSGSGNTIYSGYQPVTASINVTNVGKPKRIVTGNTSIYQLGYGSFSYESGDGKLMPINFQQQALYPERPGAIGFNWFLREGVTADLTSYVKPATLAPALVQDNNPINFSGNVTTGVVSVPQQDDNQFLVLPTTLTLPTVNGSTIDRNFSLSYNPLIAPIKQLYEHQWHKLFLAWINEIWETVCVREFALNYVALPGLKSGSDQHMFVNSVMKCATYDIKNPQPISDWGYGVGTTRYYGIVAPIYPFGYGELHYLNSNHNVLFPDQTPCIGHAWWLKPGVSCEILERYQAGIVTGMNTPTGEIRIADGATAGFAP